MNIYALQMGDLSSFKELLQSMGAVPPYSMVSAFGAISCSPTNLVLVAKDVERVVGSVTVFIETKFIHDGGLVGHIEDVMVHPDYRRQGIAWQLVLEAVKWAKEKNCYKVILNCREELVGFYQSCGFRQHEVQMRLDLD